MVDDAEEDDAEEDASDSEGVGRGGLFRGSCDDFEFVVVITYVVLVSVYIYI